jgi:hypothetical protein
MLLIAVATPRGVAVAQTDYRNLDAGRPVRTEDAYSIERYAIEFLVPYRFESARGPTRTHLLTPELEYGAWLDTHVGVALPLGILDAGGATAGVGAPSLFALHNFNSETTGWPALALRTDLQLPIASIGDRTTRLSFTGIATRSWGRTRAHLNVTGGIGSAAAVTPLNDAVRWSVGGAVDRTLYRQSVLLVGEVAAARAMAGGPATLNLSGGLRWQWHPTLVLDAGLTRRLRAAGPNLGVTVGLSHTFGFASWMPRGGGR